MSETPDQHADYERPTNPWQADVHRRFDDLEQRLARLEHHSHRTDFDALKRFTTTPLLEDGKVYDSYAEGYKAGWGAAMVTLRRQMDSLGPAAQADGAES